MGCSFHESRLSRKLTYKIKSISVRYFEKGKAGRILFWVL